ncbi:hypothetical protein KSS87_014564 [Heliosperma pusillum]|nr:hypothetical protein KSS87_014564 [Heliosperma pusillum]
MRERRVGEGEGEGESMWKMGMKLKRILSDNSKVEKWKATIIRSNRKKLIMLKAVPTLLLWIIVMHSFTIGQVWRPKLLLAWPSSFNNHTHTPFQDSHFNLQFSTTSPNIVRPPKRVYRNNGYLMVSCNGGLNQMRAAICDMVAIARHLNVTLIVPELDKTSFWNDPSEFQDIFAVDHFITSLRDEVRILKDLPLRLKLRNELKPVYSLPPVSWSDLSYYQNQILPLFVKNKVVHLNKTDTRLANNGLPLDIQKLRCKVNYDALKFTPQIEELGKRVVKILSENGPFLVLHLRYEMDMLSFSGCTQGCNKDEADELTRMRYSYPWWKEKIIDSDAKRRDGLCPLTPEETALTLQALGIDQNIQIYIASGEIYGGKKRMVSLASSFPNLVRKETLLEPSDLNFFRNHSSQMAALDYLVSLESDIFVPTYDGNMAKVVEGHRRFMGFKKTITLDSKLLVQLIDKYTNESLSWDEFSVSVKEIHANRLGSPHPRTMIPDKPKEEDYFYANPWRKRSRRVEEGTEEEEERRERRRAVRGGGGGQEGRWGREADGEEGGRRGEGDGRGEEVVRLVAERRRRGGRGVARDTTIRHSKQPSPPPLNADEHHYPQPSRIHPSSNSNHPSITHHMLSEASSGGFLGAAIKLNHSDADIVIAQTTTTGARHGRWRRCSCDGGGEGVSCRRRQRIRDGSLASASASYEVVGDVVNDMFDGWRYHRRLVVDAVFADVVWWWL